jgi:hypothetical protein
MKLHSLAPETTRLLWSRVWKLGAAFQADERNGLDGVGVSDLIDETTMRARAREVVPDFSGRCGSGGGRRHDHVPIDGTMRAAGQG